MPTVGKNTHTIHISITERLYLEKTFAEWPEPCNLMTSDKFIDIPKLQ